MNSKDDIIKKIYYDKSGYGSIKTTFDDVKKIDKTIKMDDIKQWFKENVEAKQQIKGMNSFSAPYPYYEYQFDLFFINDLEKQKFKVGALMINIFTKYMVVVAINSKNEGDVASALLECLNKMGKNPEIIYTDDETSLSSKSIQDYLKEKNIKHIISRGHPWFAERAIRTFKDSLYKRIDNSENENPQWNDYIFEILLTYNNKLKHSSTKFTPNEARQEKNELTIKLNMELHKKHNRKYPVIQLGDKVKIYRKKKTGEKERTSHFNDEVYEVEKISESLGQTFFKLKGMSRQYTRNELLKV